MARQFIPKRVLHASILLSALVAIYGGMQSAFAGVQRAPGRAANQQATTARRAGDAFLALDAIEPAVTSYVNIWTPYFKIAQESGLAPEFLLHWGHGAAMGTFLVAMCGYGTFLGWQTRLGNGGEVYVLSLGQSARTLHPLLMGLALFLFALGGQGGLVLLANAGQPILQSAHSSTAVIGLGLMASQAGLGVTMADDETKRTAHAFLGSGVMVVLFVHMYFGLGLGGSF